MNGKLYEPVNNSKKIGMIININKRYNLSFFNFFFKIISKDNPVLKSKIIYFSWLKNEK